MSRRISPIVAWLIGTLLAGAPVAFAMPAPQDPPTPAVTSASVDLRSPDARDATRTLPVIVPAATPVVAAPDAADAARGIRVGAEVVTAPAPTSAIRVDNGFEWGDAAIGAAALLGLLGLAGGVGLLLVHHRRSETSREMATG